MCLATDLDLRFMLRELGTHTMCLSMGAPSQVTGTCLQSQGVCLVCIHSAKLYLRSRLHVGELQVVRVHVEISRVIFVFRYIWQR